MARGVNRRRDGSGPSNPAPPFAPTEIDAVFGSLRYDGKAKTIEEMNAAVAAVDANRSDMGEV
jgi:hypothetical protein